MKKIIGLFIVLIPFTSFCQNHILFETINYKKAVKNGTRSRDGKPGVNYWQNHSDYNIKVKLDTTIKKIIGNAKVIYYNESPDTLHNIVIRLYKNRYQLGANRNINIHKDNIHKGVEIKSIKIDDKTISLNGKSIRKNGTNLMIKLETPILPKSSVNLEYDWKYKEPVEKDFRRSGFYKDKAWFIAYFYPQIAVYDDIESYRNIKGWDYRLYHKGIQEFYNDFNNYIVEIEAPKNHLVWATGKLTNAKEVLSDDIYNRFQQGKISNQIVNIVSKNDLNKSFLKTNIWKFKAENVMDFAFGTAYDYLWDATSIEINNQRIFVDVAYNKNSKYYPGVINIARKVVEYSSNVFPAIPFPYQKTSTFNGMHYGGMEFPMIANDMDYNDSLELYKLVAHEIFHNYIPFSIGLNEKRYPFIDEGFAELFHHKFSSAIINKNDLSKMNKNIINNYKYYMLKNDDHTSLYSSYSKADFTNVSFLYYKKPCLAFKLFIDYVGEEKYKIALKEFFNRWQGKHPTPYDYFYTMNDVLKENYNWFWQKWYFEIGYCDVGISKKDQDIYLINEGGYPIPVDLIIEDKKGKTKTISLLMDIWKNNMSEYKLDLKNSNEIKSIRINSENSPDIFIDNNEIILSD